MGVQTWEVDGAVRRKAFANGPVARVVVGAEAGLRSGLVEVVIPAGAAMPEHDHGSSEVMLVVLGGEARLTTVATGVVTKLASGSVVAIPIGERVAVENRGDEDLRMLVSVTPPSFAEVLAGWPEAD
ncbi:MAG: cupin domain-containing protein [Solirubrobacteraceae bacterium]